MGFKKLEKQKESAIVTAVEKIIDNSRHNPGTSLNKIAAEVLSSTDGMTPELARRACEAYNKSKSVYTLSKRATEDRAEDFDLINPDEVHKEIYGYHQKAASAKILPTRSLRDNFPQAVENLKKVAFDLTDEQEIPEDEGVLSRELYRTAIKLERSIGNLRTTAGMQKQASEMAIHRACQVMRRMSDKQLKKVAHLTINRYGDDGVRLVKLLGAYIDKDLPLNKTANAAIFPLNEPYPSIAIAIDEAKSHVMTKRVLEKTAGKVAETDKWTGAGVERVKRGVKSLLDPALDFAKSPIYAQITKEQKKPDEEVFDASLRNQLQQLRAQQAFVDVASDDFVKDYPIDDSIQAYNNVVGTVPELLDEKYSPWLRALVREQLVQGNVYDANTIQQLQTIGKEIQRGRMQSIDEAAKQLEAGKGGTTPGLELITTQAPAKPASRKEEKGESKSKGRELDLKERELELQAEKQEAEAKAKNREINIKESQAAQNRRKNK